ncbi:hypothetical protein N8E86_01975 [Avibacterium paragallinarum]|nr:hypothetical protein [Avibacterium paragallinarum]UXN35710.1 hypothetical protein N8E86_01975 [Avibacterium paragallinarum]
MFNNQRTLHTRNKFTPKFDGNDRWLLRLFGLWEKLILLLLFPNIVIII